MKSNFHLIAFRLIFLTIIVLPVRTYGQELSFKELKSAMDWQAAIEDSKISGNDIFLDIYATWCGPCKMMDANVYTDSIVSEFYNSNYINLKIDGETEFGAILASRYKLSGYPSMYFINSGEELIYELIGYREPEALVDAGKLVKESGKRFMELTGLYNSTTFTDDQRDEFITLLIKFGQKELLSDLAGEKMKSFTEADILDPANKAILLAVGGDILSFPVKTALKNPTSLKESWGEQDFNTYLSEAFNVSMLKATELYDTALMESIAEEFVPVYMMDNTDRIPEAKLTTRKIYYSEVKDWERYIQAVESHFNDFEMGNLRFLYLEVYYIVENQLFEPQLLDKSNEWLEMVIARQPDFEAYFLAAIVNTYREDKVASLKWMNMAESVAVTQDERDSLEELRKYLEEL